MFTDFYCVTRSNSFLNRSYQSIAGADVQILMGGGGGGGLKGGGSREGVSPP